MRTIFLLIIALVFMACNGSQTGQTTLKYDVTIIPFSKIGDRLDDELIGFLIPDSSKFSKDSLVILKPTISLISGGLNKQKVFPDQLENDNNVLPVSTEQLKSNLNEHYKKLQLDKVIQQAAIVEYCDLSQFEDYNGELCVYSNSNLPITVERENIHLFSDLSSMKNFIDSLIFFDSSSEITILWKPTFQSTNRKSEARNAIKGIEESSKIIVDQTENIEQPKRNTNFNIDLNYSGNNVFSWNSLENCKYKLTITSTPKEGFRRTVNIKEGSSQFDFSQFNISAKSLNGYSFSAVLTAYDQKGKEVGVRGNSLSGFKLVCGQ
jgi:hypothetical protein